MLADLDPRYVGLDRVELAADAGRGIRLQVKHVLVRRSANQVDEDDRLVRVSFSLGRFESQEISQREPDAETADLEEVAAGKAITEVVVAAGWPENLQHGMVSCGIRPFPDYINRHL